LLGQSIFATVATQAARNSRSVLGWSISITAGGTGISITGSAVGCKNEHPIRKTRLPVRAVNPDRLKLFILFTFPPSRLYLNIHRSLVPRVGGSLLRIFTNVNCKSAKTKPENSPETKFREANLVSDFAMSGCDKIGE